MTTTKDMTQGSVWKNIIYFAIPIFISNLFQQLYNSVDSLIVGNFVSKQALAAVSSSGNLIFLFNGFITGTAMGAGVLIAKYFGSKNYSDMKKAIHTDIAFGLTSSLLLTILGTGLSRYMLIWMGTAEDVLPESITYFTIYFLGVTGIIMYNILSGIMQAVGNSRRPLYYLIFASCLNVLLDLLFVAVFKWGVAGAAFATGISQLCSSIMCLIYLMKKGTIYQVEFKEIRFYKNMITQILKYGIPSGIQNSVIAIANVFVQSNINSFGSDAMAGCGTYSKLEGFAFLPITSFNLSITTFVGQNLGAKEYKRAKEGSKFAIITSMILAELIGVIFFFTIPYLARLFNDDEVVISYAVSQCRIECFFYCLLAFAHCVAAVCRGAGKAIVPMIIMLAIWCVLRVIYIYCALSISHTIELIFWAYPLTWGISSVIFLFYFLFSDWVHGFDKKKKKDKITDDNDGTSLV
ncbi:MAG: MATE family efflux transporter [Bacilli bacterium]|jgi:putative MATE family efflux protein